MSRLTRDRTAEPVPARPSSQALTGTGKFIFPCLASHEQDWQPYRVDPYSDIRDDHTHVHTPIAITMNTAGTTFRGRIGNHTRLEPNLPKAVTTYKHNILNGRQFSR